MKREIYQKTKNQKFSSFDQSKGIELGIKRHLKTYSTDREESRQPESFSLKMEFSFCLFDWSKNKLNQSNPKETEFLKNLENFSTETSEKQLL